MLQTEIPSLTVQDLSARLRDGHQPFLLDVRETHEVQICALPGHHHIPLGELTFRAGELSAETPIVVYCHHGGRSARAAQYLLSQGFQRVENLTGGIHAWATQIDPTMAVY